MAKTGTGGFRIGFRRLESPWQNDPSSLVAFAKREGFDFVDLGQEPATQGRELISAGLNLGTVDLPQPWGALGSPDGRTRADSAKKSAEWVTEWAALGVRIFFVVAFPEDESRSRAENLRFAAEGYATLCDLIRGTGAKIAIEGYPGRPPHYCALACTPEGYRTFFGAVGSDLLGVNFDPSHLLRMGIDPLRFLDEFAPRVIHVHAKDTQIIEEGLYQFGNLQPATLARRHDWGGFHWRYTIPGRGQAPWKKILEKLKAIDYGGGVSIELEDEEYGGTEDGERRGLLMARDFLMKV